VSLWTRWDIASRRFRVRDHNIDLLANVQEPDKGLLESLTRAWLDRLVKDFALVRIEAIYELLPELAVQSFG
jgi:hypothetical protein